MQVLLRSAQVLRASCRAPVALRLCANCASCSVQAFCAGANCSAQVPCASCSATFQPELRIVPRTTFILQAATFEPELRSALRLLFSCLNSCDRFARRHSENASTRKIPAKGSSGTLQIRTTPQRERFDHADPGRGSRACQKLHKVLFLTLTTDPQRGSRVDHANLARACQESPKVPSLNIDHTDLRRGSRAPQKSQKVLSFFTSPTPISEGVIFADWVRSHRALKD